MFLRKFFLAVAMVAACSVFSWGTGFAADAVSLTFQEKEGLYSIEGSFLVQADREVVWDVLTDYEHIPKFVNSLKKSHVREDLGVYHFLLEQEFEGGFLFFTRRVRVVLDVHEVWRQNIVFHDIGHKDFDLYAGRWNVQAVSEGIKVNYRLLCRPNFSEPFAGDVLHGNVKGLLESVRKEILLRQSREQKENSKALHPTEKRN